MRTGRSSGERGMSLIEIMVVISILGLASGAAMLSLRSVGRAGLRGTASQLAGAIRYSYDRAVTTNSYYRVVLDFEAQSPLGSPAVTTSPAGAGSGADVTAPRGDGDDRPVPVYRRWWFWTLLIGVAAGGATAGAVLGTRAEPRMGTLGPGGVTFPRGQ